MALIVVSTGLGMPAVACPVVGSVDKTIDSKIEEKIVSSISKDISLPEEYSIISNNDTGGYLLVYRIDETHYKLIDISSNYKIQEIWDVTTSVVPGGYEASAISDKGNEFSVSMIGDPTSDSAKMTVYDSSSGITTMSIGCYEVCMGACGAVVGESCVVGCGIIAAELVATGLGAAAAFVACLAACGAGTIIGCDTICGYIC